MFYCFIALTSAYNAFLQDTLGDLDSSSSSTASDIWTFFNEQSFTPETEDYAKLLENPDFNEDIPVYQSVGKSDTISGAMSDIGYPTVELELIQPDKDTDEIEYYMLEDYETIEEYYEDLQSTSNPIAVVLEAEEDES